MTALLAFVNNRRVRDLFWQALALVALAGVLTLFIRNASDNMVKAGIASGFDFLGRNSGIDVAFTLTGYTEKDTILALFWTGVANTLFVSVIAAILASLLGFVIGLARLSSHWLLSALAGGYIELVRNIPLLFFVLFWYFGVIAALPGPRDSISIGALAFLNNRGLTVPWPENPGLFKYALGAIAIGSLLQFILLRAARRRKDATGRDAPTFLSGVVLLVVLPLGVIAAASLATGWDMPALRGFNYRGGRVLIPEFVALLAALVTYTAAFIAEIVRGGIGAIGIGQREAAGALGLRPGQTLRLIVIPQALRVIIPPLTSQYLNVLKNSSFGAVIAFPELVSLFMGSALTNVGQAIEIIAMTLAVYLVIGLAVSGLMNWYNARIALVAR